MPVWDAFIAGAIPATSDCASRILAESSATASPACVAPTVTPSAKVTANSYATWSPLFEFRTEVLEEPNSDLSDDEPRGLRVHVVAAAHPRAQPVGQIVRDALLTGERAADHFRSCSASSPHMALIAGTAASASPGQRSR